MSGPTAKQGAAVEPITVKLADLVLDDANQIRRQLSQSTAERYASAMIAGAQFPPIVVAVINDAPVLVDGWHRVTAAKRAGLTEFPASIINATPNELRWYAAAANLRHGLPLSRNEAREVFRAYVRAKRCYGADGTVKSSREIAADLNGLRTHQTILAWMKKDFWRIWQKMIRDEEPRTDGGEPETLTHDDRMTALVMQHLKEAKAAMRGVADADKRGEMIAEAEAIVKEMKALRPWKPYESDF